mgnify:CR=1 FL=1|jgi:hypothetical protein
MGQLEQNFKTASLELIDNRNRRQEIEREGNDLDQMQQQINGELNQVN